ncbi:MAG: 4-hydroxythreonine-4-phosphate dehydrogenase PdxA [Candidatus Omnitrophota bacterium]
MPISRSNNPIVGITIGDPKGIGPEVTLKAIGRLKEKKARIVVIGSGSVLRKLTGGKLQGFELVDLEDASCPAFAYLEKAVALLKQKKIDRLVTAPVSKAAINAAGIKFSGHTEYLAKRFKVRDFAMLFVAAKLKVALVTRHIPLREVSRRISPERIIKTVLLTANFLKRHYQIKGPRIAVCGLNPHAGEGGLLGEEELSVMAPAIQRLKAQLKNIYGPLPSDTVFLPAAQGKFDAVVAMYHDQAMIPIKTLAFAKAVNVTLGLPFIRTSPAHGTAFDIAGKNLADPASMFEALKLAIRL